MLAQIKIRCAQCGKDLGVTGVDSADLPEQLQAKINKIILAHRKECRYYGVEVAQ